MSNEVEHPPFLRFLEEGVSRGGFETDDILAVLLPLMRQTLAAHDAGLVAPLCGIRDLLLTAQGSLGFAPEKAAPPQINSAKIEELQAPMSQGVEIVAQTRRTADIDAATLTLVDLTVQTAGGELLKPVFLPGYQSWEHALGHHDELTDIFSLGLLLASLACGLDFTDSDDLATFVNHRTNLFGVTPRLNPVLARVIGQMTELNRHRRVPELGQVISRLVHYRDQAPELDFDRIEGFKESGSSGKRQLIQSHLRDRLFEISRRNRLIYFKPSLQMLNLTVASVPILLDYRNIRLEQLFVWHRELAATVTSGTPMSLGKYLRFEDAPYISGVLDQIISEARRDRGEFGFAQLRLVLCFLRWNNLREAPGERIHSPLLLLPVELTKKKGVRDSYVLNPATTEAEVNPALRHHLKELFGLDLPEVVDLRETSLDQFHASLRAQIQASEPGVELNKIDRPQIELIHERARQRVDQYRRRMKIRARASRNDARPDYSYDRENRRPLGLQLFLEKVRPTPMPLRDAAGGVPQPRLPRIVESSPPGEPGRVESAERQMFALREADNLNPYSWDFDLCSLTLGNFNYRKMTLVRDYANLIASDLASAAFDRVFALSPKPPEEAPPPPLDLQDQHLIISCDATQASAIARARTGASYIIQGPPGTGKSQTITNLIADYVARGKRVLFVCEKRAALDIVFHRLRQQGLDELCCLIHDSQTDKKAFIQNLKQTYEKFLNPTEGDPEVEAARASAIRAMEQDLAGLRRFSDSMSQAHRATGVPLRALLHRLVRIRGKAVELPPAVEDLLPEYPLWIEHGEVIERLRAALVETGGEMCFAAHPLRWLGKSVMQADRPLETLTNRLDRAEELLDAIESSLELSALPAELWDTIGEIQVIIEFAVLALPLAERNLLGVLSPGPVASSFDSLAAELDEKTGAFQQAREKTAAWNDPFSPDDTDNALAQAQSREHSPFRFLQPGFWRLRKALRSRYDFTRHAVAPSWSKLLTDLSAMHRAQAACESTQAKARKEWQTDDLAAFRSLVERLRSDALGPHQSVKALVRQLNSLDEAVALIKNLADIQNRFKDLDSTLGFLLAEHGKMTLPGLANVLTSLRDQTGALAELSPILGELVDLPDPFDYALRHAPVPLGEFEAAVGHKSLNLVYRKDRVISRFEGRGLARKMDQLRTHYRNWLALNARSIRVAVRRKFLDHVNLSAQPLSQLAPDQKSFKKTYAAGRRDLEHEFGKTMRYKSIRDLAAGETGGVIQDLKPIWLMSPLSVSDTLPLDSNLFDVVIFDEASQIPLEEAIPAVYRSHQVVVVGDEMQLPPTTFFTAGRGEEDSVIVEEEGEHFEIDLDSDSFLTQSAMNLPSTLLAWHYRSRYESLISFSNAAFYSGNLFTIPDRQRALADEKELVVTANEQGAVNVDALLARSISFHFMQHGVYEDRRNPNEAAYIAQVVRGLLQRQTRLSIGVVAFSEAQQAEIEGALGRLAAEDSAFAELLEAEYVREENDQFCGLIVKNLENVQGDERDIIIMSVCYAKDPGGRLLMNFGPINQRGGEKRLNVIFSRAKQHMAVVSSIRHTEITNDYNDGANSLKNFLQYSGAVSRGNEIEARRVLENLNPLARKALSATNHDDAVVEGLASALRGMGYVVDLNVGQSKFRCHLAVRHATDHLHQLGILVDTDGHYASPDLLDRYLLRPEILRAFGWRFALVLTKDWYHNPDDVLTGLERLLRGGDADDSPSQAAEEVTANPLLAGDGGAGLNPEPSARSTEGSKSVEPDVEYRQEADGGASLHHSAVEGCGRSAPGQTSTPSLNPRYFEFIGGSSRKFWEVSLVGQSLIVRFGRIGTSGQSQTKTFDDETRAKHEENILIAEKLRKGYVEKGVR